MDIPCPQCGSTNYEEEDGLQVCENGHYIEGAQQVVDTEQEFGAPRGKVTTRKVERVRVKITKVYRGARAFRLYLQAWQHILWKQCYAMIHTQGAPPELWTVARDLWTLRLSLLTARLEDSDIPSYSDVKQSSDLDGQLVTTDTETSAQESDNVTAPGSALTRPPTLIDTLSTIVLSLTFLHFPLPLCNLHKFVLDLQIPYIRAIRHLPSAMTERLPAEYHLALDTVSIPRPENLPKAAHHMMQAYSETFQMQFPAINWPLMLRAYIERLALPIEVYAAVKKLKELLKYEFRWEMDMNQLEEDHIMDVRKTRKRHKPVAWPEAQLTSLLVVAVKMLFPFGHHTNMQGELLEPRLSLDWTRWSDIRSSQDGTSKQRDARKASTFLETTDRDVQDMNEEDLDRYMDWFQKLYTETDEDVIRMAKGREAIVRELLKTFPVEKAPTKTNVEPEQESEPTMVRRRVVEVQQSLHVTNDTGLANKSEDVGGQSTRKSAKSYYPVFSTPDDLDGKHNETARTFHNQAAQESCMTLQQLLRAVVYTERRLVDWADARRRDEAFDEAVEDANPYNNELEQEPEAEPEKFDASSVVETAERNID